MEGTLGRNLDRLKSLVPVIVTSVLSSVPIVCGVGTAVKPLHAGRMSKELPYPTTVERETTKA
jgi:hypothetical protein